MNRKIDKKSFILPNFFGMAVDGNMKMSRRLNHLDFQAITRVLALAISEHTIAPTKDCLNWVVSKLFDTYGKAIMADPNNEDVSVRIQLTSLQLRFRRERQKAGVKLSGKGGRPRKQLTHIYNPGVFGQEEEVDMVSYLANVQVLIEQHKTSGNAIALKTLTDLTFSDALSSPQSSVPRLCDEIDRILGVNYCMRIRESWMAIVPKIITLAKSSSSASVIKVLRYYASLKNFETCFGWCKATILTLLFMQTEMLKLSLDDEDIHYGSVSIFTNALDAIHEEQE
ncbi:hypothetical protein OUZ56_032876 [Daphnia magna]|uniref:Uncharacterized protein n=1 Tax=Daphnia magna TaxID=35525 RepID=A0ABR0B9S1_9CRUS|nr:hypothetical protein OUZ56_032876 [Daphnia magna]